MPSTPEDRAARRESRRLNREENPRRDNLAGYQTESARLFGVSVSSDDSPGLDNSDYSASRNRRRSSQMERNLSGIGEELNDSSEGGDNTMQPPGQDAAQSSPRSHRAGPFKEKGDTDYDDDSNGEENNPFVDAHDHAGASNDDSGSGGGSRRSRSGSRRGVVPEQEFHPAKLDRSARSENRSENAVAFNMEDDLSPTSRPRHANMVASTITTSSAATQRVANTEDESSQNYYDLSRQNEKNKFMGVLPDDDDDGEGYNTSPLYNDIVQPSPFDASDKEDPYEHPQTYRPFSGGSQGSSTGEHYASMQELLDDEKSRSFVNHRPRKNRFGGCGFGCGFDSLFGGKRTKRRKITLLMIVLLLCAVIGICLYFVLGTGGGNKKGDINAQSMNQMPEREKPGQSVPDNTTGTDSTFGMDEHSDDVFSREPTFPDDSKLSEGVTSNSPSTAPSVSPVSTTTSSLVPTPYDTAPTTAANPYSPESTSTIVPTPYDTAPATNPNPPPTSTSSIVPTPYDAVYGTLRPTSQPSGGSTSVSVPSLPPVTAAPVSYPTNPPIAISVPSVMTDISGELMFTEPVPQDTETSLIIFLDALKKSIRATIAPSLDTRDELVYVEIISINGEAVDSLLLRRRFIRRRLQESLVAYQLVVISDCASSDCSDSQVIADDVYSRTTNEMSSSVSSGRFLSDLEVNMLSSSGGTLEYVGGVESGDFSEPKVTVLYPTVESGTNETSSSSSSCPPGLLQVDGLPGCCVPDTSYHGDGACDPDTVYNTAACNFDGGDCCKETCNLDSFYGCGGPQSVGYGPFGYYCQNPELDEYIDSDMCTVTNRSRIGDGRCDAGIEIYNTAACNWDGGDCCQQTCDERYAYFSCDDPAFPYDCQDPVHAPSGFSNQCKFCEEGSFDPFLVVPGSTLNCDQLKSVVATEETGSSTCLSVQQAEEFCCPKSVSTAVGNTTVMANATSEEDPNDALAEADNVTATLNGNETTFANLTSDDSNATEAGGITTNGTSTLDGNETIPASLTSATDVTATDAGESTDNVTAIVDGNETIFTNLTSDDANTTEAGGTTDSGTSTLNGNETIFTNFTSDDSNATEAAGTTDNGTAMVDGNETIFANLTSDDSNATEAAGSTDNVTAMVDDNETNSTNLTFAATVTLIDNETMSTNVTIDATVTIVGNESISTNLTSVDNIADPGANSTLILPTNETISVDSTADNVVDPDANATLLPEPANATSVEDLDAWLPTNETISANSTADNVVDPGSNATLGVPTNEAILPDYSNSTAKDNNMAPYTLLSQLQGLSASALYGFTVAMSSDGNIVAVGAKDKADVSGGEVGAVLLYSMETSPPTLIQTLVNVEPGGEYGNSIGLSNDGNRLVVGARSENVGLFEQAGVVRVYERDAIGQWVLMGTPIVGTSEGVRAGWSVSISGDGSSVAVGAPKGGESEGGAVFTYRFEDEEGTWIPYGTVLEGSVGEAFGYATSLSNDGNLMAVGTPKAAREGLQNVGKASVFYLFGTEWVPLAGGSEVYGIDVNDIDGTSVALSSQDGSILVVGGKGRDVDGVSNAGHCRIYKLGTEWEFIHSIEGQTENGRLGTSVAVSSDGNVVACGGETDGSTGVVKVWNQATSESSTVWPSDKQEGALFGYAVSLNENGKMLAVGAPEWNSATAGEQAGAVEIYTELIS